MKVNPATEHALAMAAERLRYQNKLQQIHRMEELARQEKLRLKQLRPNDPTKGTNVDITV